MSGRCEKWMVAVLAVSSALGQQVAPQVTVQAPRARSIAAFARPSASYLGVAVLEIDSERARALKLKEERGVEIKVIDEGSPAAKAGLKENDVVLDYNGQRVEGLNQFIRMVSETPVGRHVAMQISRAGALQTVSVTLEARPAKMAQTWVFDGNNITIPPIPPMPHIEMPDLPRAMSWHSSRMGIETESLNSQLAEYFGVKEGVLVRSVSSSSPAGKAGIKAGDVIVKVNGESVKTSQDVTRLREKRSGNTVSLQVMRRGQPSNFDLTFDREQQQEN